MATEAVAATKWCPLARALYSAGSGMTTSFNRDSDGTVPAQALCLGSDCQAWRWRGSVPTQLTSDGEVTGWDFTAAADSPTGADLWTEPLADAEARREGYCGAFGEGISE
jgi:hypothetical protein